MVTLNGQAVGACERKKDCLIDKHSKFCSYRVANAGIESLGRTYARRQTEDDSDNEDETEIGRTATDRSTALAFVQKRLHRSVNRSDHRKMRSHRVRLGQRQRARAKHRIIDASVRAASPPSATTAMPAPVIGLGCGSGVRRAFHVRGAPTSTTTLTDAIRLARLGFIVVLVDEFGTSKVS